MKKVHVFILLSLSLGLAIFLTSADHIDAPAVTGGTSDVADFYVFESPSNASNMVFVATMQGLKSPMETAAASFDENVLIEFNIDNTGDQIEDLVIQATPRDGKMYVFGPEVPTIPGKSSTILVDAPRADTDITAYGDAFKIGENGDIKVFAGATDDPFFFDLGAYSAILGGTAGGFSDPGTDTFAGTNVLAVVVEVPKSSLGTAETINTWVETKRK